MCSYTNIRRPVWPLDDCFGSHRSPHFHKSLFDSVSLSRQEPTGNVYCILYCTVRYYTARHCI